MSPNNTSNPQQQRLKSAMAGSSASPGCTRLGVCFATNNPFDTLAGLTDVSSCGGNSAEALPSSGESLLGNRRNENVVTPTRAQGFGRTRPAPLQLTLHGTSQSGTHGVSPTFDSPGHASMRTATGSAYGSPQSLINCQVSDMQAYQIPQRRDSYGSQAAMPSPYPPSRLSLSSPLQPPMMLNPPWNPTTPLVTAIPEYCTVQEHAFRQGQHEQHNTRDGIRMNPYADNFNNIWARYYQLGKAYGSQPADDPTTPLSPSNPGWVWPVFINPYTQNLESPDGHVDLVWARKVCEIGLDCMDAMVRSASKREGDWQNVVIDMPAPCRHALAYFPDLFGRYERLKKHGHEAVKGGRPAGY